MNDLNAIFNSILEEIKETIRERAKSGKKVGTGWHWTIDDQKLIVQEYQKGRNENTLNPFIHMLMEKDLKGITILEIIKKAYPTIIDANFLNSCVYYAFLHDTRTKHNTAIIKTEYLPFFEMMETLATQIENNNCWYCKYGNI